MAAEGEKLTEAHFEVRVRCKHCGAEYWDCLPLFKLPALDDEDSWALLEGLHNPACTYIWTRGFRRPSLLKWGSKE